MSIIHNVLEEGNLRAAWEEVAAKNGSAGIDQVSITRWRRNWEERLQKLSHAVRTGNYRAARLKRFSRPKKDGSLRHFAIPTVTDRVLQRAVLRVVDDHFDRTFLDCSFGYRQQRGVKDAIPMILGSREHSRKYVLDAEIVHCFENMRHDLILDRFTRVLDEPILNSLLEKWLRAGETTAGCGLALGAVISPLLCNILLHDLDLYLSQAGFHPVRYADDFCVFCANETRTKEAMLLTKEILSMLSLKLHPVKTHQAHFDSGFDFIGVHFYRDTYSFTASQKKILVRGPYDPILSSQFVPEGYEDECQPFM